MTSSVSLRPMTAETYHAYFGEYRNDPELYTDKSEYVPFADSPEWVDGYIQRQIRNGSRSPGGETNRKERDPQAAPAACFS